MEHVIGVIGIGVWGCHSLERELAATGRARIKTVYADDSLGAHCHGRALSRALDEYAAAVHAEVAASWMEVIADPEIDIVSVMVCPRRKSEILAAAIKYGKAVVTDKPLGLTAAELAELEKTAGFEPDRIFMLAGYWTRPGAAEIIDRSRNGEFGEIRSLSLRLNFMGGIFPGFEPSVAWRREIPSAEMTTIGAHAMVTAMQIITTPPQAVYARPGNYFYQSYADVGAEDWADLNLRFAGGAVANLCVGRIPYRIPDEEIILEVTGTHGYAVLQGTRLEIHAGGSRIRKNTNGWSLRAVFDEYLDLLEQKLPPRINYTMGKQLQQLLDAAIASARRNQTVELGDNAG